MEELSPNINQEEEVKLTFKERIQVFLRNCHDVRVSSKVTFVVGVLLALVGLLALLFYGLEEISVDAVALSDDILDKYDIRGSLYLGEAENQIIGMFVFFFSVFLVITGVIIAYFSFNYITVKHRIKVTKTIPIALIVAEAFSLLTFLFEVIYLLQFNNAIFVEVGYTSHYIVAFIITFIIQWLVMIFTVYPIYYLFKNSEKMYISKYKVRGEEND